MASRVLLAVYVAVLAVVGFFPTPVDRPAHGFLTAAIHWGFGLGASFVTYSNIEFVSNILLFVPLGLLLTIITGPRRRWLAPASCLIASCAIELGQALFLPERVASVGDVIANTIGGVVGTAIAVAVQAVRASARRRAAARAAAD